MRSQKIPVPIRLLNGSICLSCKDLEIEDNTTMMTADDQVFFMHNFRCKNVNRCERMANDIEKSIREKFKNGSVPVIDFEEISKEGGDKIGGCITVR